MDNSRRDDLELRRDLNPWESWCPVENAMLNTKRLLDGQALSTRLVDCITKVMEEYSDCTSLEVEAVAIALAVEKYTEGKVDPSGVRGLRRAAEQAYKWLVALGRGPDYRLEQLRRALDVTEEC